MRTGEGEQDLSGFLLDLGSVQLPVKQTEPYHNCIEVAEQCVVQNDIVQSIFADFNND